MSPSGRYDKIMSISEEHEADGAPPQDGTGATPAPQISLEVTTARQVHFAHHQNSVPVIQSLAVSNPTEVSRDYLTLEMTASPRFVEPRRWSLDRVPAGGTLRISDRDTRLNAQYLLDLREGQQVELIFRLIDEAGDDLAEYRAPMDVLARNEWGGYGSNPELLAAFSMPNEPAVDQLLRSASDILRASGEDGTLHPYEKASPERIWLQVSALWSAVLALDLDYAYPPCSFESGGQKIRTPGEILASRRATCLDSTMLLASLLEQAHLQPLVVLEKSHAYVGVWLKQDTFAGAFTRDFLALRKRVQLKEILVMETTLLGDRQPFTVAVQRAVDHLQEAGETEFEGILDIARARDQRIRPLSFAVGTAGGIASAATMNEPATAGGLERPSADYFTTRTTEWAVAPTEPGGRLAQWQRKLLDLTLRNPLLKLRFNKSTIPLVAPDPGALEDLLAQGKKFSIEPAPGFGSRDGQIHAQRTGENLSRQTALAALARHKIYVQMEPEKLEAALIELYRKARNDLEEGGSNTLFMAVGVLRWQRPGAGEKINLAPLILLPVTITRQSVRSGIKIALSDDEPRFNTTLLEMLRQDFGLHIEGLDGSLPTDGSGTDIPAILTRVRQETRDVAGFEVVDDVYLGTFSFAKYLMWKDLVDRTDQLKENPVVRHLMENPREPFQENHDFVDPRTLDDTVAPGELYTPLSLDSSQLAAVVAGAAGKNFVMIGPPGTGKSQTISNMIAHNLGLGRTVLFVSEKVAALNVVYRRLQAHGLGEFCLELHSNKARKLDVIRQLGAAWDARGRMSESQWTTQTQKLKVVRDELNQFVRALHTVHKNGLTARHALSTAAGHRDVPEVRLAWAHADVHDRASYEALLSIGERLTINAEQVGSIADHPLAVIHQAQWSSSWQEALLQQAAALSEAAGTYQDAIDEFARQLDLPEQNYAPARLRALAVLADRLQQCAGKDLRFLFAPNAEEIIQSVALLQQKIEAFAALEGKLSVPYTREKVLEGDVTTLDQLWARALTSWWLPRVLQQRKIRKLLQIQLGATALPDPARDLPVLRQLQALQSEVDALAPAASQLTGWRGLDSDTARMAAIGETASQLRQAISTLVSTPEELIALRSAVEKLVVAGNELLAPEAAVGQNLATFQRAGLVFQERLAAFATEAARTPDELMALPAVFDQLRALGRRVADSSHKINAWCAWRRIRAEAVDAGLLPVVSALELGTIPAADLKQIIEVNYARWWVRLVVDATPALRTFVSVEHQRKIENFSQLDEEVRKITAEYIRTRIRRGLAEKDDVKKSSEYGIIRRELEKKTRHKPLRQLISEAPNAIPTLTPCLLMSPLSIAQYLPVDQELFDVVIFDEASQITVWDSIGAIARGKQAIVVGDPKQLPPTSFFDATQPGEEEDEEAVEDLESILDEMLGSNMPAVNLAWHYRSRHESLITFSNQRYYGSGLVTFPSPVTQDRAVNLTFVGGTYERGVSQTNRAEADAVVEEIRQRLQSEETRHQTLGVVTFNQKQQKLILDLLEKARQNDPELDRHFAEDLIEPVFVKNLEAVQGDERDVILFSTTFGPDKVGKMSMNFGPLNNSGGERRLNVAITRARIELKVFTSMRPDQIDLARTAALGVRDFKHFLEFAERGPRALDEAVYGSQGDFESPLESAVAAQLREKGWVVQPQIGVSTFRIDLGIVHPNAPGSYLAGIECDGATYHRSATARDRDLIRESVLRSLGWNILRLWSTDYWLDPAGVINKLHAELEALLSDSQSKIASASDTEKTN